MTINVTLSEIESSTIDQHEAIEDDINQGFLIFYVCVVIVISVAIVIGNAIVIVTLLRNEQLKQPCNYFIVSLSLSDLLFGLFFPAYNAGQWSENIYTKFLGKVISVVSQNNTTSI